MTFTPPDPQAARTARAFDALTRLASRHAATPQARSRQSNPHLPTPAEAVRVTALLAGGSAAPLPDEEAVDGDDLIAALTLFPDARAELDELELTILTVARARGMSWSELAFGLGLASPQAAQQRYQRLTARTGDAAS